MSKVICDVCGTTYAETATQCPICGCAKNSTVQTAAGGTGAENNTSAYAYVRGGRFSKGNVRRRNRTGRDFDRRPAAAATAAAGAAQKTQRSRRQPDEEPEDNGVSVNKGLVVVVIILLLAIVAVAAYIGVKYLLPGGNSDPTGNPSASTDGATGPDSTASTPAGVPCTEVTLSNTTIEFFNAGDAWLLSAEVAPADTTETVVFTSADEAIATVTETGYVTAVSGGETTITVTCGSVTVACRVVCSFEGATQPTEEPTEPTNPVDTTYTLTLNREDFTLSKKGETWKLFKDTDTVKASDVTWTSDDETVATVVDGVVTAVGNGTTKIHAQYNGQTASCTVRCSLPEDTAPESDLSISHTDVTISVGETFLLSLSDSQGVNIQVEWQASEEGYVSIDGKRITGTAKGTVTVTATYEGETFSCIIRVIDATE